MKVESREFRVEQSEPVNEPRYVVSIDMDRTFYPSSNNLLLWSEDFSNAAWLKANVTVTPDVAPDPNGEITADNISEATSLSAVIRQIVTIVASTTYTYSVHFKKDAIGRTTRFPDIYVIFSGSTPEQSEVYLDTETGEYQIGATNADPNVTAGVEDAGNYWRLWMSCRSQDQANNSADFGIYPVRGGSIDWLQNPTLSGDVTVWGAQLNDAGLLPYLKTEATAITALVYDPNYFLSIDNFILWSEDFTNVAHIAAGAITRTPNTDIAPDGTTTADTLEDTDVTTSSFLYQILGVGSTSFRYSMHIKVDNIPRTTRFVAMLVQYSGSTTAENNFVAFDTQSGDHSIIAADPGATVQIEFINDQVDDPYWRVIFETSQIDVLHNTALYAFYPAAGAGDLFPFLVATTGSAVVWGGQFTNINSSVKYIKTEGDFVNIKEAKPDILYLTSHTDCLLPDEEVIPENRIDGVIMPRGISGQTQKINPDIAQHTIGNVSIKVGNFNDQISSRISQYYLNDDLGLRKRIIKLYQGFTTLQSYDDYALHFTYLIEDLIYNDGIYTIVSSDIQRTTKTDIFELQVGVLTSTITDTSKKIPITIPDAAKRFPLIEHDLNYSANPSINVGYIRIDDEVIAHSGWDANFLNLNVIERGALNTRPVTHQVTASETDRKKKVEEYGYLEMAVPRMIYYLLTGKDPSGKLADLPTHWNLGIDESFVTISDFLNIGEDLWDPIDDTGRIARFIGLEQTTGKEFIEKELLLWSGCFMPIYSDGTYGLKQLQSVLPYSSYDAYLEEDDISNYSQVRYDMKSVINNIVIYWNWIENLDRFTKITQLIDSESIYKNGSANKKTYEFQGVFSGVHTDNDLVSYFGQVRDRYASPPFRFQIEALPKWNILEVGDTIRVTLPQINDSYINQTLDRTFEVQQVQTDWITGKVKLNLFGGVEAASQQAFSASFVMQDSFYDTSAAAAGGIELSTVLTIVAGVVTVNGTLTGAAKPEDAIYYYDGDLTIADGVTVTWTDNIEARIRTLTVNGEFTGAGQASVSNVGAGGVKGPNNTARDNWRNINYGVYPKTGRGAIGVTITGETAHYYKNRNFTEEIIAGLFGPKLPRRATREDKIEARTGRGKYGPVTPIPKLKNPDGLSIGGLIKDYRGVGGGGGQQAVYYEIFGSLLGVKGIANGGDGGQGGGGLVLVTRGLFFGANGSINSSGGEGAQGENNIYENIGGINTFYSGAPGGPGHPGGIVVLIDGDAPTPNTSKFITKTGTFTQPSGATHFVSKTNQRIPYVSGRSYGVNTHFGFFGVGSVDQQVDNMFRIQYIPPAQNGFVWFPEDENLEVPREGYGDKRIPDDPVNFQAHQSGDAVVFKWDKPLFDSAFEIRYAPLNVGSWEDATPLTISTKGTNITTADVSPGAWTFYVRAVSFIGIYSDNFSQVNLTVTTSADIIQSYTYEPEWDGSLTNLVKHYTGKIVPTSQDAADSGVTGFEIFDEAVPNPFPTSEFAINDLGGNWLRWSEDFNNPVWVAVQNPDIPIIDGDGPFAKSKAIILGDSNSTIDTGSYYQRLEGSDWDATKKHTWRIAVKKDAIGRATRFPRFRFWAQSPSTENNILDFDTSTGESNWIPVSTDASYNIIDYNSEWWVIEISFTSNDPSNNWLYVQIYPARGASATWVGGDIGVGSITVAGNQVFDSDGSTNYVKTSGTQSKDSNGIDIDFDDQARVWGGITSEMVWSDIGIANPELKIDYRLDGEVYDGFESWSVGVATFRYVKNKIVFNNIAGSVYSVSGFTFTVDNIEKVQKAINVNISAGGSLITFPNKFHALPFVRVFAEGTSSLYATYEQVTTTSFIFHIWNDSGTDVGGVGSWEAIGV